MCVPDAVRCIGFWPCSSTLRRAVFVRELSLCGVEERCARKKLNSCCSSVQLLYPSPAVPAPVTPYFAALCA